MRTAIYLPHSPAFLLYPIFDTVLRADQVEDWSKIGKDHYIMFGGGTDVNPVYYHEPRGKYTQDPDVHRDRIETKLFNYLKDRVGGFIGICRGAQLLTVTNGGKLVQDVTGHTQDHWMKTIDGRNIWITSTHHQMMYPFILPKGDYQLVGVSAAALSRQYLSGWNAPIETPPPHESEIVWYPKTKSLAVQGHPEYMMHNDEFPEYFRMLVKGYLFNEGELKNMHKMKGFGAI